MPAPFQVEGGGPGVFDGPSHSAGRNGAKRPPSRERGSPSPRIGGAAVNPWFPLHPECAGRDMEIAGILQIIGSARIVGVTGAPGIGKSHLAGTVACQLGESGVVLSLAGCLDRADVVRSVGDALGVFPCGDEAAVRVAAGTRWLLVDDVNPLTAEALLALDLQGPVVLVGEVGDGVASFELGPLPLDVVEGFAPGMATGNPLHALLGLAAGCRVEALPERLDVARSLAGLPMGLGIRVELPVPAIALRPDARDRRVLRAGVAALVPGTAAQGARWVDGVLSARPARREALRSAAFGAAVQGIPDPRDVLLLRLLAQQANEMGPSVGVWSAAAGARLALRMGQVGEARGLLRIPEPRGAVDAGLLRWVDGDALLALGDVGAARACWRQAEVSFRLARDVAVPGWVELALASAEQLALRGHEQPAGQLVAEARALAREVGALDGVAASWRASAALAASMGEPLSASQFLAEAGSLEPDAPTFGVAVCLLAREGRTAEALRSILEQTAEDPLQRANLMRRRADLHLREGTNVRAGRAAREAAALYASVGEHVSSAQCLRVAADALALSGHLGEAAHLYAAVLSLQVRVQDLAGLERTLLRAALVDEARGAPASAIIRREQRAALVRLRG